MHTLTATVNPRGFDSLVEFLLRCNGDVSKVQEKQRRASLCRSLYSSCTDGPGIPLSHIRDILQTWVTAVGPESEDMARLLLTRVDLNEEGCDVGESDFVVMMLHMLFPCNAHQFD
eukprot:Rhum_TRINITY_DN20424_c0_g1::Rhum_TRINITY_DN20424_c0_g1_i1::g.171414::m.171414